MSHSSNSSSHDLWRYAAHAPHRTAPHRTAKGYCLSVVGVILGCHIARTPSLACAHLITHTSTVAELRHRHGSCNKYIVSTQLEDRWSLLRAQNHVAVCTCVREPLKKNAGTRTHACTHARARARTHACTHTRARTHTGGARSFISLACACACAVGCLLPGLRSDGLCSYGRLDACSQDFVVMVYIGMAGWMPALRTL